MIAEKIHRFQVIPKHLFIHMSDIVYQSKIAALGATQLGGHHLKPEDWCELKSIGGSDAMPLLGLVQGRYGDGGSIEPLYGHPGNGAISGGAGYCQRQAIFALNADIERLGPMLEHGVGTARGGAAQVVTPGKLTSCPICVAGHASRGSDVPEHVAHPGVGHDTQVAARADIKSIQIVEKVFVGKDAVKVDDDVSGVLFVTALIVCAA